MISIQVLRKTAFILFMKERTLSLPNFGLFFIQEIPRQFYRQIQSSLQYSTLCFNHSASRRPLKQSVSRSQTVSNHSLMTRPPLFFPILHLNIRFQLEKQLQQSMKTSPGWVSCFSIFVSLLALMPTVESFCASSYTFPHSTCTFEYGFNDSNCSIFAFSRCSWSACTSWSAEPQNSYCQHHQNKTSTDWEECTSSCCTTKKEYPYQFSSLQECQADIQQSTTLPMIIFTSSIIGGCLLIFSLILFCCCKERIYEKCNCIKGCCQAISGFFFALVTCRCYARTEPQKLQKYSQKSDCSIESSWSINHVDLNEKLKDVCSVCLQINPTLQLQCHHVFHRQCIVACMAMKKECVMCRSKEFNKIKVYCEVCLTAYFQTTLLKHMKALADLKQVCSHCRQTQDKRNEVYS